MCLICFLALGVRSFGTSPKGITCYSWTWYCSKQVPCQERRSTMPEHFLVLQGSVLPRTSDQMTHNFLYKTPSLQTCPVESSSQIKTTDSTFTLYCLIDIVSTSRSFFYCLISYSFCLTHLQRSPRPVNLDVNFSFPICFPSSTHSSPLPYNTFSFPLFFRLPVLLGSLPLNNAYSCIFTSDLQTAKTIFEAKSQTSLLPYSFYL